MNEAITAYPLTWPTGWRRTPHDHAKRSPFGYRNQPPSTWKATQFLLAELNRLPARDIVVSTNLRLRKDGMPASDQRAPDDAGAAVWFVFEGKPSVLACDKWKTVGENLHAIAKHVEALRGQERWGVGTLAQAFTGYAQLPAETGQHWTTILGLPLNSTAEDVNATYREIVRSRSLHPDMGGDRTEFEKVTRAREEALRDITA